jgi:hypothetical protein
MIWPFFIAIIKVIVYFVTVDDWSGRCETPAGVRGRGDPAGALAPRRLPGPPARR